MYNVGKVNIWFFWLHRTTLVAKRQSFKDSDNWNMSGIAVKMMMILIID